MKKHLLKSMLVMAMMALGANAWAQTTYFSQDYEGEGATADWTSSVGGRFTPTIMEEEGNHYLSVDQGTRNNNGCVLSSTSLKDKVEAGTDFTMTFDVKIGTSNNQSPVEFNIYDAANSAKILGLVATGTNATTFIVNGNSEQKPAISAGGGKGIADLTWMSVKLSRTGALSYLTITNKATSDVVFERELITTLSENGGLGKMEFITKRYNANFAIDNVVVREIQDGDVPTVTPTTYTIKFVDEGGNTIKDEAVVNTIVGLEVTASADYIAAIYANDKKYIYVSGNTAITTVEEASSNVITLVFREAATWNYTVNATGAESAVLKVLATGTAFEGDAVTVPYPLYINVDGTLWEKGATNKEYRASVKLAEENTVANFAYSATEITNVVYLTEGEDVEGTTLFNGSNANIRSSNAAAGWTENPIDLVKLPAGKYKINGVIIVNSGEPVISFKVGTREVLSLTGKNSNWTAGNKEFVVATEGTLNFVGGNAMSGLDFVYIQNLGNPTEEELAAAKWSEAIADAEALVDAEAVAVGLLEEAIVTAKAVTEPTDADYTALQAAVDQFKKNNADQEKDQTAKVATDGWKNFDGGAAGVCATQFAPAITTYDGRNAQLAEVYESNVDRIGTIIYQDITGLENGTYKVGFYGNAFFTSGRGFESSMADGAEDVAYVFANDQKAFITAKIATSTTENNYRQFDVEVTNGTIKLGMGKEKAGTNWHTMQIYQLTWFTTAKAVYAQDKAEMKALIEKVRTALLDENKTKGLEELNAAQTAALDALDNNKLNIAEFEAEIAKLQAAYDAFIIANRYVFEGVAYIIDAESGNFMAAGHNYGTRGIVNETGLDLTFAKADNNTVTIDTKVSNGGNNHFLGSNLYMDAAAFGWALEYQGFGFYISNGTQYISIDENDNLVLSDTPREWIIVTADGVKEQRLEEMADATETAPIDVTWMLQNPNFNRNDQRVAAWVVSDDCTNKNLNGGNEVNNCAESYHSVFTISQTIEDAPAGTYQLTAQGFYRQDDNAEEEAPVFYLSTNEENIATAKVPAKTGDEGGMSAASESFTAGKYASETMGIYVNEGETITVGVKGTATHQWVIFDNFRLTYFGANQVDDLITTGISEVNTTAEAANAIYNLAGQKVQKAQKGLFIINGKKVVK